jgi:hypothetical protein
MVAIQPLSADRAVLRAMVRRSARKSAVRGRFNVRSFRFRASQVHAGAIAKYIKELEI